MNVVDEYITKLDEPQKSEISRLVLLVQKIAPEAMQVITYGMPGYKYKNKYLISIGVFKDHMSIYPGSGAIDCYKNELTKHKTSKGTIQFTIDNPLPQKLFEKIVKYRIDEINR